MLISGIFNQFFYPGARGRPSFDCWVIATIQAANAVAPWVDLPTVPEFRKAAGDPLDGKDDGGNMAEIMLACRVLWPELRVIGSTTMPWATFLAHLKANRVASLSITSGALPLNYRYGYDGGHQVVLFWEAGVLWIGNPLQPQGSPPRAIAEASIRKAAHAYSGANEVTAAIFPSPAEAFASKPKETPPMPAYDPIGQAIGQVTVTTAGHALYLPHEPDPAKAYVQIATLPFVRNVFGAGKGDAVNCPPAFRGKDFWIASWEGNVAWLRKQDAGTFVPAPVVVPIPNCTPAVKAAVNAALDKVLVDDIALHRAAIAARKIA